MEDEIGSNAVIAMITSMCKQGDAMLMLMKFVKQHLTKDLIYLKSSDLRGKFRQMEGTVTNIQAQCNIISDEHVSEMPSG